MSMTAAQLVAYINAIQVGDLDAIRHKIGQAREACVEMSQDELAEVLGEAEAALDVADMKTYRKRLATVVAKLGHLK